MLVVPESVKAELRKPLGPLLDFQEVLKRHGRSRIIAVGDIVTLSLLGAGIKPCGAIYDFISMRLPLDGKLKEKISSVYPNPVRVSNPRGTITPELEGAAKALLKCGGAILVDGEEDLAALVLMALAPRGFVIIYGQPAEGVVAMESGKESRKIALGLLGRMEKVQPPLPLPRK